MLNTIVDSLSTLGRFIYAYKLTLRCAKDLYKIYNNTFTDQDGQDGPDL